MSRMRPLTCPVVVASEDVPHKHILTQNIQKWLECSKAIVLLLLRLRYCRYKKSCMSLKYYSIMIPKAEGTRALKEFLYGNFPKLGDPRYRPQHIVILIMGTSKKAPLLLGNLHIVSIYLQDLKPSSIPANAHSTCTTPVSTGI